MAVCLGFADRMILVNQRGAKKEGIFETIVCNTREFDTFDQIRSTPSIALKVPDFGFLPVQPNENSVALLKG